MLDDLAVNGMPVTTATAYRSRPIKRRARRTGAQIEAIQAQIIDVLEHDHPMTVRQVYYQLVTRGVIEKTESEYKSTVVRLLGNMRRKGRIPYEWIADAIQSLSAIEDGEAHDGGASCLARWTRERVEWRILDALRVDLLTLDEFCDTIDPEHFIFKGSRPTWGGVVKAVANAQWDDLRVLLSLIEIQANEFNSRMYERARNSHRRARGE